MSGPVPDAPLAQRLGLGPGMRAWLPDMPAELRAEIERGAPSFTELELPDPPVDIAVMIVSHCATLDCELRMLLPLMAPGSLVWVGWSGGSPEGGLDEEIVRRIARPLHLADAEPCTLVGQWSGLKLIVPAGSPEN
ncbi:MAG: hypothetical protein LOX97_03440 [Sphingomonas sp.]|nr:hypothetical protein [Sphingomonas sp.]